MKPTDTLDWYKRALDELNLSSDFKFKQIKKRENIGPVWFPKADVPKWNSYESEKACVFLKRYIKDMLEEYAIDKIFLYAVEYESGNAVNYADGKYTAFHLNVSVPLLYSGSTVTMIRNAILKEFPCLTQINLLKQSGNLLTFSYKLRDLKIHIFDNLERYLQGYE